MTSPRAAGRFTGETNGPDGLLRLAVFTLVLVGIVTVYSASAFRASDRTGDFTFFLERHALRVLIAFGAFSIAYLFDYHHLIRLARVLVLATIVSLVWVLVDGWNDPVRGSIRWIRLGPLSFQPSEVAKLVMVIYLTDFLSRKSKLQGNLKRGVIPCAIVLALMVGLVALEKNLSGVIHLAVLSSILLFLGGVRIRHMALLGVILGGVMAVSLLTSPYQIERIMTFFNNEPDPLGKNYQVEQSLIALGSGGVTGVGIGQSRQKYYFLPDSHTDFVFSVIGEEGGFLGTGFVMALFLIFGWRGMRISMKAQDSEGRLLAAGITLLVFLYAMLNIAVVTHAIPTTGVPLPFVSYGGSSLLVALFGSGVLLNISRQSMDRPYATAAQAVGRLKKRRK